MVGDAYFVAGGYGNDNIDTGYGDDRAYGQQDNDKILGGYGGDTLNCGSGDDSLLGESGNDSLARIDGNDVLLGGFGDDTLIDGDGRDRLLGGIGADVFAFQTEDAFERNLIYDFEVGMDMIRIEGLSLTFGDISIDAAGIAGAHTVISYSSRFDLVVFNILASDLTTADFTFT